MAKKAKTGGRNWKKGQSGNPAGRKKVPEDVKQAIALTKQSELLTRVRFQALLNTYVHLTEAELTQVTENPNTPALDHIVINIIQRTKSDADTFRLNFILDTLIGKAPAAPQEHNFNFNLTELPRKQVIDLGTEAIKYLQEAERGRGRETVESTPPTDGK